MQNVAIRRLRRILPRQINVFSPYFKDTAVKKTNIVNCNMQVEAMINKNQHELKK